MENIDEVNKITRERGFRDACLLKSKINYNPLDNYQIAITCAKGVLVLEKVQPEGKKEMTGKAFLNGYRDLRRLMD